PRAATSACVPHTPRSGSGVTRGGLRDLGRIEIVAASGDRDQRDIRRVEHTFEFLRRLVEILGDIFPEGLEALVSVPGGDLDAFLDRKSTRLNSSHQITQD